MLKVPTYSLYLKLRDEKMRYIHIAGLAVLKKMCINELNKLASALQVFTVN